MAYNREVEKRLQKIISQWKDTERKNMFGGLCYLLKGNMVCGIYRDFLILRLGEKGAREALQSNFVRPFDITGKPMRGWVMVEQKGFGSNDELIALLEEARDFVERLPQKQK
jgi:TfoX/Sxy family transcriptional regulator of competence genes